VTDDRLCGRALIPLRDTLESMRRLGKATPGHTTASDRQDHQDQHDDQQSNNDLSTAELLPTVNMWLFYASHKIIQPSDNFINTFPHEVGMLGELARAEGVVPKAVGSAHRGGYLD
jgi:Protein of unknown function (DUF3632)